MNISSATQAALQGVQDVPSDKRAELQMSLLKKVLQNSQDESATLMKMMSGVGQNLDIRV